MIRTLLAAALAIASVGSAAAATTDYAIDPHHTMVIASWSHMGYSHPSANFAGATGTLSWDDKDVTKSKVTVTIPMDKVDTFVPALTSEFLTDKFFDTTKYPTATFTSTRVEAVDATHLKVTGNFAMHGVTKPVTLDVTLNKAGAVPMMKAKVIGFDATGTLVRSAFGVGAGVPMVGDEVTLRITTEAHAPL